MMEGAPTVDEWLSNLLSTFRSAWANEALRRALGLSNLENFSTPCQVYLFWFRLEPDIDYCRLVRIALTGRPDGETEVIGPINPADASGVLTEVLRWERWSENIEDPMFLPQDESDKSARMELGHALHEAQREFDKHIVRHVRGMDRLAHVGNRIASPGGFHWDIYGDPRSLEPGRLLAFEGLFATRPRKPAPPQPQPERIPAHGAHIYPHVCVGELPLQTPEEVLQGSTALPPVNFQKAFATQYQGKRVVVMRDGLIAIESESKEEGTNDLNNIMAAILLSGTDVRAVRLGEVGNAQIDPVGLTIVSWGTVGLSMRTASLAGGFEVEEDLRYRDRVDIDVLRQTIANAEAVSADAYLQSVMSFLLEAHTQPRVARIPAILRYVLVDHRIMVGQGLVRCFE